MSSYRQVLERVAQRSKIDPNALLHLERRRRRRHRNRRLVAALMALAIATGGMWGAVTLASLGGGPRPTTGPRLRGATAQGITLSFPEDWTLIQLGHIPPDSRTANLRLPWWAVFQLSNYRPTMDPSQLCPEGRSMPADGVLLYVQRVIGTTGGSFIGEPWPIEPQLSDQGAGGASSCGIGYHQRWTVGNRNFEALIAFGPEASAADREALLASFHSLDFRWIAYQDKWISFVLPSAWDERTRRLTRAVLGTPKEVLASMTTGRQRFTFLAVPDPGNLFAGDGPTLEVEDGDIGPLEPPGPGEFIIARRYIKDGRLHAVVGSATLQVARVDVVISGRTYRATLLPFPSDLPGGYQGYFVDLDRVVVQGGEIVARDAAGRVLQRLPLG